MSTGHAHASTPATRLRTGRLPRLIVVGLIVLSGLTAALGVLHWWPDGDRVASVRALVPFAVSGTTVVHGDVLDVAPACTGTETMPGVCGGSDVHVTDGAHAGRDVKVDLNPDVIASGVEPGDHVLLLDFRGTKIDSAQPLTFYRVDRGSSMLWFAILFAVAVIVVAWRGGLMALVSLAFAAVAVVGFLIPALLSGEPAVPVALATSIAILIVMLYITHGFSMRTSVALLGALIGVGLSTWFAWAAVTGWRLGGVGDESSELLINNVPWVNVQQLIVASVILAGLGTLNDVTVTQASALWELRSASPGMSRWDLFRRAMRIGRDHVASTVYTLVFAYLGTALVLIVGVQLYGGTARDFITAEDVAEEIVRALVGGLALVLAMPITTAIGAFVVTGAIPAPPSEERATTGWPENTRRSARGDGFEEIPSVSIERTPAHDDLLRLPENPWNGD